MIDEILEKFIKRKVKAVKYNNSLDKIVQNFCSYDCYIQISPDKQELIIMNKKPKEFQKYILEVDPDLVQ